MKRFLVKITFVTIVLALIGWLVFSLFLPEYYLPILPFALLFFLIVTILVHAYQLRLAKTDLAKFTRSNMIITFIKLIIYSVFTIVFIATNSENAIAFVICIMLIYLAFNFIEVAEISRISRKGKV